MTNRSPAWTAAAAVATTFLQLVFFAAILPRPAAATDLASPPATSVTAGRADPLVARGKYRVSIAGCHDCHTEGYAETGGNVPAARWLTGTSVGFKGPWGVSYLWLRPVGRNAIERGVRSNGLSCNDCSQ